MKITNETYTIYSLSYSYKLVIKRRDGKFIESSIKTLYQEKDHDYLLKFEKIDDLNYLIRSLKELPEFKINE